MHQAKKLWNVRGHASPHPPIKICNLILRLSRGVFMETQLTIFVHTPTNWNHLSDDQVKAPTLQDFKQMIVTPSAI